MPIKLLIAGRPPIELVDEQITLGSAPGCTVNFPASGHVCANHAVIRLVDGLWLIEVRDAACFFVGGAGQKKAHLLRSGNVIRLSEGGPELTVEITEQVAPLAQIAPLAESGGIRSNPRQAAKTEGAPLSDERPRVRPSDVILLPESDAEISTTDAPLRLANDPPRASKSSADVPKFTKPGSDSSDDLPPPTVTIRASKAPTSTTIPTMDAPTSATIRTSRSKSGEVPTGNATPKSAKSGANIPTKGAKRSASSAQIPVARSNSDEPSAGMPVLKRLSSWEAPEAIGGDDNEMLSLGEAIGRRRKGHDADVEWIKMVVLRCAGVGLIVLLTWLCIREFKKAMTPVNPAAPVTVSSTATG